MLRVLEGEWDRARACRECRVSAAVGEGVSMVVVFLVVVFVVVFVVAVGGGGSFDT